MPRTQKRTRSTDTDSRTSAVGRKRPATSNPKFQQTKRRKGNTKDNQAQNSAVGPDHTRDFAPFSSLQGTQFAQGGPTMEGQYGRNRLQSGFVAPKRTQRNGSQAGTIDSSDADTQSQQGSVPQLHDTDTTDDDGGMTLNVEGNDSEPIIISDDDGTDDDDMYQKDNPPQSIDLTSDPAEEGEISDDGSTLINENNMTARERLQSAIDGDRPLTAASKNTSQPQTCLKDLSPGQLEDQIRYAFWHLKREEIDLSRPARCLHCQAEGHVDDSCPDKVCPHCSAIGKHKAVLCPQSRRCAICRERGHEHCDGMKNTTIPCDLCRQPGHAEVDCVLRHYPELQLAKADKLELWISCSSCASKSHLVGDCPELALRTAAPRWSLKTLDPNKITNLSLQHGMTKLEKDAQNKNMRPNGLKIRGRADRHNAGFGHEDYSSDADDMDQFLSHAPKRQTQRAPPNMMGRHYVGGGDGYRPAEDRYDRFAAPSDNYRPPRNAFYSTDSFGRPRSRSPPRLGGDSYRPGGAPPGRRDLPDRASAATRPGAGVSLQLPNRKGSNPNLAARGSGNKRGKPGRGRGRGK